MGIAPDLRPEQTSAEQAAAVDAFRDNELRSRLWKTPVGHGLLHWFWRSRLGRWFMRRFAGATAEELHGYEFWGPVALAILVTELLGTGWLGAFDRWPTISTTVGHLQDLNSLWGVPVVGLLALAAFYAVVYQAPPTTGELYLLHGRVQLRYGWPVVYALVALATLIAYLAEADRFQLGYVLYGSLAVFGVVVPLLLVHFKSRRVVFPTLFFTFAKLRHRFRWIAALAVAGLSILVIHLALYPWPNLARDPATFAGLTGEAARKRAERAVSAEPAAKPNLVYSTRSRNVSDGQDAWFVFFNEPSGGSRRYAGCFVIVTGRQATLARDCLTAP